LANGFVEPTGKFCADVFRHMPSKKMIANNNFIAGGFYFDVVGGLPPSGTKMSAPEFIQ
jgi:hypothetical protein